MAQEYHQEYKKFNKHIKDMPQAQLEQEFARTDLKEISRELEFDEFVELLE